MVLPVWCGLHACRRLHLRKNEHVRIDVLAGNLSKRTRDWIDLFGHFFFPAAVLRDDDIPRLAFFLAFLPEWLRCPAMLAA